MKKSYKPKKIITCDIHIVKWKNVTEREQVLGKLNQDSTEKRGKSCQQEKVFPTNPVGIVTYLAMTFE